jgi:hypothetical protein
LIAGAKRAGRLEDELARDLCDDTHAKKCVC